MVDTLFENHLYCYCDWVERRYEYPYAWRQWPLCDVVATYHVCSVHTAVDVDYYSMMTSCHYYYVELLSIHLPILVSTMS